MRSVRFIQDDLIYKMISYRRWPNFSNFFHDVQDLEGHQALLAYLDLVVPQALLDQVVREEEREPRVPLDHKENEAAEDYQDLLDLQTSLANQLSVKKDLTMDAS